MLKYGGLIKDEKWRKGVISKYLMNPNVGSYGGITYHVAIKISSRQYRILMKPSSMNALESGLIKYKKGDFMYTFDAKRTKNELVEWIRELFNCQFEGKNCCVALSGGKDSSIVAALAVEALGKERVKGLMLPQYTQVDIEDSILCAETLGIDYKIMNIGDACRSIHEEANKQQLNVTEQARVNLPARIRMAALYFYAQCVNGIPSCNCNLSEDLIGYSTYGGDNIGGFAPLANLTVTEVRAIGRELGLPVKLVEKTPSDGLCGKSDEENFGFTYDVLDHYIRTGEIEDREVKAKIDELKMKNQFKVLDLATFYPSPYFIKGMNITGYTDDLQK